MAVSQDKMPLFPLYGYEAEVCNKVKTYVHDHTSRLAVLVSERIILQWTGDHPTSVIAALCTSSMILTYRNRDVCHESWEQWKYPHCWAQYQALKSSLSLQISRLQEAEKG